MSVFVNGWAQKKLRRALFHSLALHIIQQGSKKVPTISKLESDSTARQTLLLKNWRQQCQEKKAQAKGWRQWLEEEMGWQVPDGEFWQDKKISATDGQSPRSLG